MMGANIIIYEKWSDGLNELLTNHISLYTQNWICCYIWKSLLLSTIVLLCIMLRYCNV